MQRNDLIEHAGGKIRMQRNLAKFFERTQKYSTQAACLKELNRHRRINGFICPKCGHDKS